MTEEQLRELKITLYELYGDRDPYLRIDADIWVFKRALFDRIITLDEFGLLCGEYVLKSM